MTATDIFWFLIGIIGILNGFYWGRKTQQIDEHAGLRPGRGYRYGGPKKIKKLYNSKKDYENQENEDYYPPAPGYRETDRAKRGS